MPPNDLSTCSLEEVIKKCKKRSPNAQRELYSRFSKVVMATCLRYVPSRFEADDVFQESFIKVFNNIDQFDFRGSFEGWIRRIAANTSLKYIQQNSRYPNQLEPLTSLNEDCLSNEDNFECLSTKDLLAMIDELPQGCRLIFNLFAIEGYSHKEISQMLSITEGTSKSQFHHARKLLKGKLAIPGYSSIN